jgi:hypothetical protein
VRLRVCLCARLQQRPEDPSTTQYLCACACATRVCAHHALKTCMGPHHIVGGARSDGEAAACVQTDADPAPGMHLGGCSNVCLCACAHSRVFAGRLLVACLCV